MASAIVSIYADLIRKGKKKIEDVPEQIRDEVQSILDANESEE